MKTSYEFTMDPDGTWTMHEFYNIMWCRSVIGVNKADPFKRG